MQSNIIEQINKETEIWNQDNLTRTIAYHKYFVRNPEIEWAFLASMVSRNAGWNMCDLKGYWFPRVLSEEKRKNFFMAYERANWTIFSDAYPQLLVYELSKQKGTPLFEILTNFNVSRFMKKMWDDFWLKKNPKDLTIALIINEQNVIQKPVIEHHFFKNNVFSSLEYVLQDWMHFSTVLFPTTEGQIYGFSVHGFRKVENRILLGKRLYWLLFYSEHHEKFKEFAIKTIPTGSRKDFEQYFDHYVYPDTPELKSVYPIFNHSREGQEDWFIHNLQVSKYFEPINIPPHHELNDWYQKKRRQLQIGILLLEWYKH
jgi:hypothetical protein